MVQWVSYETHIFRFFWLKNPTVYFPFSPEVMKLFYCVLFLGRWSSHTFFRSLKIENTSFNLGLLHPTCLRILDGFGRLFRSKNKLLSEAYNWTTRSRLLVSEWYSRLPPPSENLSPEPVVFQPGAIQFQSGPVLPDSVELAALSDIPRMKWAVLSPYPVAAVSQASTYLQREIHDPRHASLWGGVHQWLGWSGKPSITGPPQSHWRGNQKYPLGYAVQVVMEKCQECTLSLCLIDIQSGEASHNLTFKFAWRTAKKCRVRWAGNSLFFFPEYFLKLNFSGLISDI